MSRVIRAVVVLLLFSFGPPLANWSLMTRRAHLKSEVCLKKLVLPGYPPLARQSLVHGDVSVDLHILGNGVVRSVTVVDGHPLLIGPVEQALTQWQFEPRPDDSDVHVTIRFSLGGSETDSFAPQTISGTLPNLIEISTQPPRTAHPNVAY